MKSVFIACYIEPEHDYIEGLLFTQAQAIVCILGMFDIGYAYRIECIFYTVLYQALFIYNQNAEILRCKRLRYLFQK